MISFKNLFLNAVFVALFAQQTASAADVSFMVIGDWGGLPFFPYRTPIEETVAKQMGKFADKSKTEFILALGDNFYFDGVTNISDPRFQETYNTVFTSTSLDVDWYFVAGNHDHNGNVTAQIDYSSVEKRWNFPNFYYAFQEKIPGSSAYIDIVMVDTVLLCGNSDHDFKHLQPAGPSDVRQAEDQWTWLEQQLMNSKASYLLVAGHYPVYSVAEHGPTACLVDRLLPMLYKYKVTAYLCGHDHNIQHLQSTQLNVTVDFFLSGAANFIDSSLSHVDAVPQNALKFHWANILSLGSFSHVRANAKNMTYTFYEANGDMLYEHALLPRKL